MTDATAWTASEALREIGAGRISAREYAEELLAQCARTGELNAFIHLDPEQTLAAADVSRRSPAAACAGCRCR